MIVYKYVIKRLGQYYSLMNYGIDRQIKNCPRYKLGRIYTNPKDFETLSRPKYKRTLLDHYFGYHFFKYPKSKGCDSLNLQRTIGNIYDDWSAFLKRKHKKDIKITILSCLVKKSNIIKENENRIVSKKFKVLGELL